MFVKQQSKIKWDQVLISKYNLDRHIDEFFKTVKRTGYPYFEWNDFIYKVEIDTYKNTGININEIK
jgi:hypothetical protein